MSWKDIFKTKNLNLYENNTSKLVAQVRNNEFVSNWMMLILIICMGQALMVRVMEDRIFWTVCAGLVLTYIASLRSSIYHNRVLLNIIRRDGK